MYLLRRAAARAIVQRPNHQLSTARSSPISKFAIFQSSKPALYRSFHQSRISRAEEDETKARIVEEEGTAPVVGEAATTSAQAPPQEVGEVVDGESSAADPAEIAAATAAAVSSSIGPPEPRQSLFNPRTSNSAGDGSPGRILYVGNLFFEVTPSQLEAEFGRFGTITNSRIVADARGQSKGFGYIEFSEQSAAEQALRELDQKVFQGRRMAVQYHVKRDRPARGAAQMTGKYAPSKTLFIGNMSFQMSDRDLNELFRDVKDVLDVRVAIDRRSGQPRGFAHADFLDIESAKRAKEQLQEKVIYGRQLRVDFSANATQNRNREEGL